MVALFICMLTNRIFHCRRQGVYPRSQGSSCKGSEFRTQVWDICSLGWAAPSVPSNSRCRTCVLYLATFWASAFGRQCPPLLHRRSARKFSSPEVHNRRSSRTWLAIYLFRRACAFTGRIGRMRVPTPLTTSSCACWEWGFHSRRTRPIRRTCWTRGSRSGNRASSCRVY